MVKDIPAKDFVYAEALNQTANKKKHNDMKTKNGFKLRDICGEKIVIAEGKENIDFSNIISMNESSAFLWEKLCGKEFTEEDMVKLLTEEYDVDQETAINDCKTLASQWKEAGIIE